MKIQKLNIILNSQVSTAMIIDVYKRDYTASE